MYKISHFDSDLLRTILPMERGIQLGKEKVET